MSTALILCKCSIALPLPDAAVELVTVAPLLQVHWAGDRRPVVRDIRLQGAVHEQVVVLNIGGSHPIHRAQNMNS